MEISITHFLLKIWLDQIKFLKIIAIVNELV